MSLWISRFKAMSNLVIKLRDEKKLKISDEDRIIALLKKVLKSGSMTDTDDSDIIANSVAKHENGMQIPNGRNCGFSRFFHGNSPLPRC